MGRALHGKTKALNERLDSPTLTIDLAALSANWRLLAAKAGPAQCAAAVKADAYGTGLEPAVDALAKTGCTTFFVAHCSEGVKARTALRAAGHNGKIYILNGGPLSASMAELYLRFALQPVLNSVAELQFWRTIAASAHNPPAAALHFNTGMNRLGFDKSDELDLDGVPYDLIMSHFVAAECPEDADNASQIAEFSEIVTRFPGVTASLANSSGIFLPTKPHFDMVRPGYALYGGNPLPGSANPMQHVVQLDVPVLQIRTIEAGARVGYNGQWTARRRTRLATLALGYADGFPRIAGHVDAAPDHRAQALIAGVLCPFVGRTSMDLTVLDITAADPAAIQLGTRAQILGRHIGIDDLAARSGTIGYQILTSLGARFTRHYTQALEL